LCKLSKTAFLRHATEFQCWEGRCEQKHTSLTNLSSILNSLILQPDRQCEPAGYQCNIGNMSGVDSSRGVVTSNSEVSLTLYLERLWLQSLPNSFSIILCPNISSFWRNWQRCAVHTTVLWYEGSLDSYSILTITLPNYFMWYGYDCLCDDLYRIKAILHLPHCCMSCTGCFALHRSCVQKL